MNKKRYLKSELGHQLLIIDTIGTSDYSSLRAKELYDIDVYVLCYNSKSKMSVDSILSAWFPRAEFYCKRDMRGKIDARFLLVGLQSEDPRDNLNSAEQPGPLTLKQT